MKKVSILLLGLVLLAACEKHPGNDSVEQPGYSSYKIGKTHNDLLAYYYSKSNNVLNEEEFMILAEDYLVSKKLCDEMTVREGIKRMISTPEYGVMFDSKSEIEMSDILMYLDAVKKYFNPSDQLMETLEQAFFLGENYTPEEVKTFVIKNIQRKTWSGTDKDLAWVFTDVFLNSYEYWTMTSEKKLKKSTLLILYDAGGALHGMIFGPVVSIIEGALVSAALSEKLPD
jgi:hypothetical protein